MCPTNGAYIGVIAAGEPLESLVDDHIMHQEIGEAIGHDTKPDRLHPPDLIVSAYADQQHTGHGKDHKKGIILFKEARFYLVMIFMEIPQKSMHHIFMGAPGYTLHYKEGHQKNCEILNNLHHHHT
jgi:hypothetical protein